MLYTLRFCSSKCSLFHNANVFGSCIIHVLYTGCAKIKKKKIIPAPKGLAGRRTQPNPLSRNKGADACPTGDTKPNLEYHAR